MNIKETTQLQTLLDNRDDIFAEFNSNKSNLEYETMVIDRKSYIVSDAKDIFSENSTATPTLNGLLDNTLNIMSVAFSEYGSATHPGVYELNWDVDYPVKRYYIANSGTETVGVVAADGNNVLKFVDWNTNEDVDFNEDPDSTNNIYMAIDIWDSTQTPTDQQIINYYLFFEHFPGIQHLSTSLQSFIDANRG